jgi:hypothetical protein
MSQQFKEGDAVLVIPGRYGRGVREPIPATITKAARVWLTITEATASSLAREWRMRRDTQREDSAHSYVNRFVTAEQYEAEQRAAADAQFLREQGIEVAYGSPWRGRVSELADLIRKAVA